jgi:anti-sigma regulatory factor (Ser/Thr protein kinase)
MNQSQAPSLPMSVAAEQTCLHIPSEPEWIAPTVEYLKQRAVLCGVCQPSRANRLTLVLHEALTNSVIHGNLELSSDLKERGDNAFTQALAARAADPHFASRSVEVRIDYDGDRCRWILTDEGNGFDFKRALARASSEQPDLMLASGRGLMLMRAFLDDLSYELGGRRAILTLNREHGKEKRHSPRFPVQRPIRIAPIDADGSVDWDAAHEAMTKNLSTGGIAILQRRLTDSERVLVGIDWQGEMLYVPAAVRHCQTLGNDVVELGCQFQLSSPAVPRNGRANVQQELESLLDQLTETTARGDERRLHPRAVYTAPIEIQMVGNGSSQIGFARDLSKGGISFLCSTALPLENALLTLPRRDAEPLRIAAHIVRCRQLMSGVYEIGASFVEVEGERN